MAKPPTKYFVDDEEQSTEEDELKVRQILQNSGNNPDEHYLLEIRGANRIEHRNLDESIKIHSNMRFAAIFTGNTRVS